MKKIVIVVAILLISSLILGGCAGPPEEPGVPRVPTMERPSEVNLGVVTCMTGGAAIQGQQMALGAQIAVDYINANGGIKNYDGAKLKLFVGDNQSLPDPGATETERLITQEEVVVIMGTNMHSAPTMVQCQKYKTPFLGTCMGAQIDKNFDWVFRDFLSIEGADDLVFGFVEYCTEKFGEGPKSFGVLNNDGDWGLNTRSIMRNTVPGHGYEFVYDDIFPFGGVTDFSSYLIKIKAAKPDFFEISMCSPDHTYFTQQLFDMKIDFPYGLLSLGCACEMEDYYATVTPEMVEYMFVHEDCNIWIKHEPYYDYLNDLVEAELGVPLDAYMLSGYSGVWDVKDALERTPYHHTIGVFRSSLRDALIETDISEENCPDRITLPNGATFCPALVRGIERVKFVHGSEPGSKYWTNPYNHGQISQRINDERIPVYPRFLHPEGKPDIVWPIPSWSER